MADRLKELEAEHKQTQKRISDLEDTLAKLQEAEDTLSSKKNATADELVEADMRVAAAGRTLQKQQELLAQQEEELASLRAVQEREQDAAKVAALAKETWQVFDDYERFLEEMNGSIHILAKNGAALFSKLQANRQEFKTLVGKHAEGSHFKYPPQRWSSERAAATEAAIQQFFTEAEAHGVDLALLRTPLNEFDQAMLDKSHPVKYPNAGQFHKLVMNAIQEVLTNQPAVLEDEGDK